MADKYPNFAALKLAHKEGKDYRITVKNPPKAKVIIVAPHAGGIEPKTGEIATAIAGKDHSLYLFEGLLKDNNRQLHITSHNFDEPRGLRVIGGHTVVLSIHGCSNDESPDAIYVGGLDNDAKKRIAQALRKAGFNARTAGHEFPGTEPKNICNAGSTKKGVQLEIARALRDRIDVAAFAAIVRSALGSAELGFREPVR